MPESVAAGVGSGVVVPVSGVALMEAVSTGGTGAPWVTAPVPSDGVVELAGCVLLPWLAGAIDGVETGWGVLAAGA